MTLNAGLLPTAFFALAFQNELQYRYLSARINSEDDGAKSCKNLVNFCLVTREMTGLIYVPIYLYWTKIDLHTCIRCAVIHKRHRVLEHRWAN